MSPVTPDAAPPGTVLIVDDTPANLQLCQSILARHCRVLTAGSGAEALALLAAEAVDVVLLDVMMPDMDGFAVAGQIQADPQLAATPIIFLTALTDSASQIRGLELGAVDFLTKPVSSKILQRRVANVIEREQLRRRLQGERQALQQAVAELRQQKAALDAHCLVSICDADGRITYANPRFCDISGYPEAELLGQNHRLIKSGLHPESFYAEIWQTIAAGHTWHGEIANRRSDGEIYWVDSTIIPWCDEDGIPYQYVAIRTDITERIRARQQLAAARQRELEIGAQIQQRLLFGPLPEHLPGFAVACHTEASEGVDGDFYTFTRLGDDTFELITGDVMGKGVAAALIAAAIKSSYRRIFTELLCRHELQAPPSPAQIMNALHTAITPELIDLDCFATLSLLRFDRVQGCVTWVNAGHTPALLAHPDGQIEHLLGDNLPLGVLANETYAEQTTPLAIDDLLLLYSDGISETTTAAGTAYGEERIRELLRAARCQTISPAILLNALRSDLDDFAGQHGRSDDRTLIAVQMQPEHGNNAPRPHPECFELPRRLDGLTLLREKIASLLSDQPEEIWRALALAAFEAATNIVRHTPEKLPGTPIIARLERQPQRCRVDLFYPGRAFQPGAACPPDFSGARAGGFGLFIIAHQVDLLAYEAPLPGMAAIRLEKQLTGAAT
ncbi:SpoIIE family protein phosphatase [Dechloromonas sp. ZY10]|uniref:SpoIIE family protein phosphatase n=1 Tax=Dechloromonas aquae TaxID=2664436 RepID=UPI003528C521